MASSTKRQHEQAQQPESKRAKFVYNPSYSTPNLRVVLNPADCNLDFNIEGDGISGHALCHEGFAYCWSGARANIGITSGRYCFGCKIVSNQPVTMDDTPLDQQHLCRIGISRGDDSVGNLGETNHSYGYGGTGKFSNAGRFSDYGERFGVGDVIVCSVDLDNKPHCSIGFFKNGKWLGIAKHFDSGLSGHGVFESAVFPHVLLKNVEVQMQFSVLDGLVPVDGYKPWASAVEDGKAVVGPSFSEPEKCEVIMMVGLPAAGKTTWAEKHVKEHPEKRYVLLGTNLALDQMKVPGLLRKHNYGERFNRLMNRATGIFNTLISRASKTPRNYILDQTNVYKSARRRKLKPFALYHKIAVVIFPKIEELKLRSERRFREMGKEVPADAVNEMLANFVLPMSKDTPGTDEYFDEVIFPELDRFEAYRILDEMKRSLALACSGKGKRDESPYSRASSVHSDSISSHSFPGYVGSYHASSLQDPTFSPVTGSSWRDSPFPKPQLRHGHPHPSHVSTRYADPVQPGSRELYFRPHQVGMDLPSMMDPYRGYGSPMPRESLGRGSYGNDPLRRHDVDRRYSYPGAGPEPYPSYGGSGPYGQGNVGRLSGYGPPGDSGRDVPSYSIHGGYTSGSVDGRSDSRPLYGSAYGAPDPRLHGRYY